MDLKLPAGLPAARADPPATAQADGHDHPLGAERDVRHSSAGQAQQALECGGDAHVALPCEPLAIRQPAACAEGGGASVAFCATSANFLSQQRRCKRTPNAALQRAASPTRREETRT